MTEPHASYPLEAASPDDQDTVVLSAGTTFVIVGTDGSIRPSGAQGFYAEDTRLISALVIAIDGHPLRVIDRRTTDSTMSVTGTIGDPTRPELLVDQRWTLSDMLEIALSIENLTSSIRDVAVDLTVAGDFADLFEVKRGVRPRGGLLSFGAVDDDLVLRYQNRGFRRSVKVHVDRPDEVLRDGIHVGERLAAHGSGTVTIVVTPQRVPHLHRIAHEDERRAWAYPPCPAPASIPEHVWHRSWTDLGTLLMRDSLEPHHLIVAAGSPWFMALFGRDSLITSWQTLPYRTDLAVGVLHALATRQGRVDDPITLEQPGRIPHEARRGEAVQRPEGWGATFYGTVDATPLFVMTLAQAWRCGAPHEDVVALLPAAERAITWITDHGDLDGDGFVEYPGVVHGAAGLANQGWKDSDDAIRHPDGTLARGPIATVEVQGYCHAAFLAMADLRDAFGLPGADDLRLRAARLRDEIDARFWSDPDDCYALALDGDKRQVAAVSSNAGHLLFTGTATPDHAARMVKRLMADDMSTGFGLRTLSATNGGYNPLSYHCGSVWPHDTALVAAGMLAYGFDEGRRLAHDLLGAAAITGRLSELFGGFAREQRDHPVPYPTSCSPQAWSAGAPLLLASALDAAGPSAAGPIQNAP